MHPSCRHSPLRCRHFTLIEMLVVVSIIAVLAALLLPSLSAARQHAYRVACGNQVRQIGVATILFSDDQDGYLPVVAEHPGMWWSMQDTWFADLGVSPAAWSISSLWGTNANGAKGFGYLNDKSLMLCPARTDHYGPPTVQPWDMVVGAQKWKTFWSTYHGAGLSGFIYANESSITNRFWLYRVKLDRHRPENALICDMVIPTEPAVAWNQLKQTNHWGGSYPSGGNTFFVDGHVAWTDYSPVSWKDDGSQAATVSTTTKFVWNAWTDRYYMIGRAAQKGSLLAPPEP